MTRDSKKGMVYVKLVNAADRAQSVRIALEGAASIASSGTAVVLASGSPADTNVITEPTKVVPVTSRLNGVSRDLFDHGPTVAGEVK